MALKLKKLFQRIVLREKIEVPENQRTNNPLLAQC
jgi:hypothetical protein